MKRYYYILLSQIFLINTVFAVTSDENAGVFNGAVSENQLKTGNISFSDIPAMIQTVTSFLLGFTASISMIMLIV